MKSWKGKTMYQVINFLHEFLLLFIISFLSFPLHVKSIILCFVFLGDHKPTPTVVYYSLRNEDFPLLASLILFPHLKHIRIMMYISQSLPKMIYHINPLKLIYHLMYPLFHLVTNSLKFIPRSKKVINL